jgi:ABC-type bacteriocin/lantibiotic exporter with double-glycine peptidase domain
MAFVRQLNSRDCGVAALAMLCNVTYEEASKSIPWRREGVLRGTTTKQIIEGAIKLGYETKHDQLQVIRPPEGWVTENGTNVDYRIWSFIANNSLVKVPADFSRNWHWVVYNKNKIYDPARGVFKPKKFHEAFDHMSFPTSSLQFVSIGL